MLVCTNASASDCDLSPAKGGNKLTLTIKQAATMLGVSSKTVERRIKSGEIKAYKFGDSKTSPVRIPEEALREYLDKCVTTT